MHLNYKPESIMRLEKNVKKSVQFVQDRTNLWTTSPAGDITDDTSISDLRRMKSEFIRGRFS
jgi:hypothetical protein